MDQETQSQPPLQPSPSADATPSPVPPPPELNLRTMASDAQSIQEQGGAVPAPQIISPGDLTEDQTTTPTEDTMVSPDGGGKTPPSRHKIWPWLTLAVILVLSGGGYYLYSSFFNQPTAPETVPTTPAAASAPAPLPASTAAIDYNTLTKALNVEAAQSQPPDTIQEIQLVNDNDQPLPLNAVLAALLEPSSEFPAFDEEDFLKLMEGNFSETFSVYLYYDSAGVWPIYRVAVQPDAPLDIINLRSRLAALENASLTRFYLQSPGTAGSFRDGQINGQPTRYTPFSTPGANFNYGIFDNHLIISTSYQGLKQFLAS